jgi:hypothetical protein
MRRNPLLAASLALLLWACAEPQSEAPRSTPPEQGEAEGLTTAVMVSTPASNARVTSPLTVEGTAPGDWFFEAQFPARLTGADGAAIAEAPALSQSDWMTEAPVPFRATLRFSVTQDTPAILILQEDMPADNAQPREMRIPVVLTPAG